MALFIDGYALASLLADAVSASGDVDGVLLGDTRVRRSTQHTDDTDANDVETRYSVVHAHLCATSVCSFYDAAGCVDEDKLAGLLRAANGSALLGWFVARRASPLTPTARETEVWRQLQRRATRLGLPPPLLGLVCSDQPEHGEPYSTQYVFFAPPDAPQQPPTALSVSVLNVGSAAAPRRREEAPAPSTGWHALLDGPDAAHWRALEAAAVSGAEQTRGAFEAALQRASALCLQVEGADDALHASRELHASRSAAQCIDLEDETTLSDDEALAAEALELPHIVAERPQPAAYEPPVLLSDADAPVGAPSILDMILAGEEPGAGNEAALQ